MLYAVRCICIYAYICMCVNVKIYMYICIHMCRKYICTIAEYPGTAIQNHVLEPALGPRRRARCKIPRKVLPPDWHFYLVEHCVVRLYRVDTTFWHNRNKIKRYINDKILFPKNIEFAHKPWHQMIDVHSVHCEFHQISNILADEWLPYKEMRLK